MILTTSFAKIANLDKRIRIVQGSSSASKTYSILQKLVLQAEKSKVKKLVSVISDTLVNIEKGAYRDFENICEAAGIVPSEKTTKPLKCKIGKWTFEFFGLDDERKARGGRREILFLNEANRVKWETARQLIMRTKETVYIDYNPDAEFWAHKRYIGKPDVDFVIVTYKDNEACPQSAIDEIEAYIETDPEWYKVYGLGQLGDLYKGKIFRNWEEIDEFPEVDGYWFGLDFGFSADPTAIVKVLPIKDRIYADEICYEIGLTNRDIAARLKDAGYKGELVICDSAEPKSITELRQHGINAIPADKGPGSINEGIAYLKTKKILITKRSHNLREENKHYKWAQDKQGNFLNKPVDAKNHICDSLRYAVSIRELRNGMKKQNESATIDY